MRIPERRRFLDFVGAVESYRQCRSEALDEIRKRGEEKKEAACERVLFSKVESIRRNLSCQYDHMPKDELWKQCLGRSLRDASEKMSDKQLRKRLLDSDDSFQESFPEEGVRDLDRKRLRILASQLGLASVDLQDRYEFIRAGLN